jgi:hypothetical protein
MKEISNPLGNRAQVYIGLGEQATTKTAAKQGFLLFLPQCQNDGGCKRLIAIGLSN